MSALSAPGVVFVEMAMEAARQHLGPEAQLRDVQMVWPFVVPKVVMGCSGAGDGNPGNRFHQENPSDIRKIIGKPI